MDGTLPRVNEFMKSSFLPKYKQKIDRISALCIEGTGCSISKRDNVSGIYRVFEPKICQLKGIGMFIGNGHLTVDPCIWLKVTILASTASVLKDGQNSIK